MARQPRKTAKPAAAQNETPAAPVKTNPESEQAGGGNPAAPQPPEGETEIPAGASAGAVASGETSPQEPAAGEGPGGGAENPASETPAVTRAGDSDIDLDSLWTTVVGADLLAAIDHLAAAHELDRQTIVDLGVALLAQSQDDTGAYEPVPELDEDAPIPTLEIDKVLGISLRPVEITGPRAGRYRRGHHFTSEPQTLLVSEESYQAFLADPAFSIRLVD